MAEGERATALPLDLALPDADDEPFLAVALAAGCSLVTGNLRHFPADRHGGARVLSPAELLEEIRQR